MPSDAGVTTPAGRFVAACQEVVRRELPGMLNELFSKLNDALYDLADKSGTRTPSAAYLEAIEIFRQRRLDILSLFLDDLLREEDAEATSDPPKETAPASALPDATRIKQVGNTELEEDLAIKNLISTAENRYETDLEKLRRHLASLRDQEHCDSLSDPLGPHRLCASFRQALTPVADLELAIKLIVYKHVIDQLGGIYAGCLACAGIAPVKTDGGPWLVVSRETETEDFEDQEQPHDRASSEISVDAQPRSRETASLRGRKAVFHHFQRLLWRTKQPQSLRRDKRIILGTHELVAALSDLQKSGLAESSPRELRRRLGEHLKLGGRGPAARSLSRVDEDTLDLVLLLFEHAWQGNQIPGPLKSLIGRLEIPTLSVALVDKSFFEDRRHPARRLLNHLAQAAVGWNEETDRHPGGLYEHIDQIVSRIAARDSPDPALFAKVDRELSDLLAKERETARSEQLRAQQAMELREHETNNARLVNMAITQYLRSQPSVPDSVISLLYEGWQQVLLAAYLRDGAGGAPWQNAMRTMERLVWSVQPKGADDDRRELLRSIPELLRTLRESLAEVDYDQRRLARWFKELQALHITALRGEPPALSETSGTDGAAEMPQIEPPESHQDSAAPQPRKYDAERSPLKGLRTGSWIELWRADGSLVRAKLAWRSPKSGIFLFVDRQGRSALELSGEDIIRLAQQGDLTVIRDAPMMDLAMRDLVRTLTDGHAP